MVGGEENSLSGPLQLLQDISTTDLNGTDAMTTAEIPGRQRAEYARPETAVMGRNEFVAGVDMNEGCHSGGISQRNGG
jgi:hypothetical protein